MSLTEPTIRRTPFAARRVGYLLAGLINIGILFAVNVVPGWEVLPFLTPDTDLALPLVNLSLAVGVLANVVYVAYDPVWLKAVGDLITGLVGLAAMARIWVVFPFDFSAYSFNWGLLTRFVLAVAIGGTVIGITVQIFALVRTAVGNQPTD
jgi:hypothetical protein